MLPVIWTFVWYSSFSSYDLVQYRKISYLCIFIARHLLSVELFLRLFWHYTAYITSTVDWWRNVTEKQTIHNHWRYEFLMVVKVKQMIFWNVMVYSFVGRYLSLLVIRITYNLPLNIQGVPGGIDKTSGECSLC